jgi:hypothetical protein
MKTSKLTTTLFLLAIFLAATLGAYWYGKLSAEASQLAPDVSEKINLAFVMQSMNFMLDAAQASMDNNANQRDQKILLLLADSTFFLTNALDTPTGTERLKDGLCKQLPGLVSYSDLLNAGKVSLASLTSDSADYVSNSNTNARNRIQGLCIAK